MNDNNLNFEKARTANNDFAEKRIPKCKTKTRKLRLLF